MKKGLRRVSVRAGFIRPQGKTANLCAGGRLDQEYLEKLMTGNGPLKLKAVNGKYYHFEKD